MACGACKGKHALRRALKRISRAPLSFSSRTRRTPTSRGDGGALAVSTATVALPPPEFKAVADLAARSAGFDLRPEGARANG